jgi:hypothetical protein
MYIKLFSTFVFVKSRFHATDLLARTKVESVESALQADSMTNMGNNPPQPGHL